MKKYILWTILACAAFISVLIIPTDFRRNGITFDAKSWKQVDSRSRGQMAKSLIGRQDKFLGRTKLDVKDTLGEPNKEGPSYMSYEVRYGYLLEWISPVKNYLIAEFDENTGLLVRIVLADA